MITYLAVVMILIIHFSDIQLVKNSGTFPGIFFLYQHVASSFQTHLSQKRMTRTGIFGYAPDMGHDVMSMSLNSGKKRPAGASKHSDQPFQVWQRLENPKMVFKDRHFIPTTARGSLPTAFNH